MASWIKDQEIVMLAHTNKTSALQAKVRLLHLTHFPVPYVPVFLFLLHFDIIYDLLLNRCMTKWNPSYLFNTHILITVK